MECLPTSWQLACRSGAVWSSLTYLPDLVAGAVAIAVGGPLPTRRLLVVTTIVQAILATPMAIPGSPFVVFAVAIALIYCFAAQTQRRLTEPFVVLCVGIQAGFLIGPSPGVAGRAARGVGCRRQVRGGAARAGQGGAALLGGVLANVVDSSTGLIGVVGSVGLVVALVLAIAWLRVLTASPPADVAGA